MSSTFQYDSPLAYDSNQEYDAYSPTSTAIPSPTLAHLSAVVALAGDGSFLFLNQDSTEEIVQSVEVICGTVLGDRPVVPTFGIPDQTFTQPSKSEIVSSINTWEQRAAVQVFVSTDEASGVSNVKVDVTPRNQGIGVLV